MTFWAWSSRQTKRAASYGWLEQPFYGFDCKAMSDDSILRERARALILSGILPNRPPDRMWGGAGAGDRCVVCSGSVTANQTCLEIEYTRHDGASTSNHHLH